MTTRTLQDLATAVMQDLAIIDAMDSPTAEDRAFIELRYTEALEELRDDGLVWWDATAIPLAVFPAVVGYMSVAVSEAFGKARSVPVDVELEAAKRRIRRRVSKATTGEQTSFTDY
jgi:hypothetical protein